MSASLVRGAHLARSVCSSCRTPCQLRLYSSHALLVKPVTIAEVFAHTAPSTSSRRQLVPVPASDYCHSTEPKSAEVLKKKRGRKKKVIIQDVDHSRNPLEDNGIEAYLNILKTTGVEPTVEDLERCRPLRRYRGLTQQYEEQFEALVDRLCRSFSRSQLRSFCAQYKLEARSNTPKKKLALLIIEKRWKWPSMDDLKRKKMEETKIEELGS
jgi:acyl-CoA-binding protein